jgi:hypothetical protein
LTMTLVPEDRTDTMENTLSASSGICQGSGSKSFLDFLVPGS